MASRIEIDQTRITTRAMHCLLPVALLIQAISGTALAGQPEDTHYNDIGFFDIHVCNWPDRQLFLMPLFSTTRYNDIRTIDVRDPDGHQLAQLDLSLYKIIRHKDKQEKRAFINQVDVPETARDGWYTATITLVNGAVHTASDYVSVSTLGRVEGQHPANNGEPGEPPNELQWEPVQGAGFYQVFIRDQWDNDRLIFSSGLLSEPVLVLPSGLLKPGGMYSWVVHARDVNEDPVLGDFNRGSLSKPVVFSVRE